MDGSEEYTKIFWYCFFLQKSAFYEALFQGNGYFVIKTELPLPFWAYPMADRPKKLSGFKVTPW